MYDQDAIYYDKLNKELQKEDIPFYKQLLYYKYRNICELACGTGRILLSLALPERQLTGIDLSEKMLDIAKQKAAQSSIVCRFICSNMCRLPHLGDFDAVICGYNSIQHILTEQDLSSFFHVLALNLADEGIAIIDLFHSNSKYLFPQGNTRIITHFDHEMTEITVEEQTLYHLDTQINDIVYSYYNKEKLMFSVSYKMKQYDPEYLDCFIKKAGFSIEAKYGDYNFSNYSDDSPKQIYILKRKV